MPMSEVDEEKAYEELCLAVQKFCSATAGTDTVVDDFVLIAHSSSFGEVAYEGITYAASPNQPTYRTMGLLSEGEGYYGFGSEDD